MKPRALLFALSALLPSTAAVPVDSNGDGSLSAQDLVPVGGISTPNDLFNCLERLRSQVADHSHTISKFVGIGELISRIKLTTDRCDA